MPVRHTTSSDNSFSATGDTEWERDHTVVDIGYQVDWNTALTAPADSQTYYIGPGGPLATTAAIAVMPITKAGTITDISVEIGVHGTLGTTENATLALGLNNTSFTTISSTARHNAARQAYTLTGQSIAVVAGDYLQLRIVEPAFVTNPTNVIYGCHVFVEV